MRIRFSTDDRGLGSSGVHTRQVPAKYAKLMVMGVFLFAFAILAGVGWFLKTLSGEGAALMAQGAVEVLARVDGVGSERRRTNERTEYTYHADLSFQDQDGKTWRKQMSISRRDYESWQIGQEVPLRYAAADPSVTEFRAGDLAGSAAIGAWMMYGGLAGLALTVLVGLVAGRRKPNVI